MNEFSYNLDKAPDVATPPVLDVPHAARVYDYYIGGDNNWAIDREFAERQIARFPMLRTLAWHNRLWMNRVVRAALDQGISQFLDLGAGIPNDTSPHVIADAHDPDAGARVVYVDNESVVGSHTMIAIERGNLEDRVALVPQDFRKTDTTMRGVLRSGVIDFDKPVCLLMIAALHFVGNPDKPERIINRYCDWLSPGSWMALSHISGDLAEIEQRKALSEVRRNYEHSANPLWVRNRDEIGAWFTGLDLIEPGLVPLTDWRPDREHPDEVIEQARPYAWCGVGQTPDDWAQPAYSRLKRR